MTYDNPSYQSSCLQKSTDADVVACTTTKESHVFFGFLSKFEDFQTKYRFLVERIYH